MAEDTNQKPDDWTQISAPGTAPKINSIFDFSAEALGQLKLWLEQAGMLTKTSAGVASGTSTSSSRITTAQFRKIVNAYNGQTVTITDIDTSKEWTLRYNGDTASWKFLYGDPIFARYDTTEGGSAASGVWTDYANGPSKVVPQRGTYTVTMGARSVGNPAASDSYTGFSIGGATPTFYVVDSWNMAANGATTQSPVTISANDTTVKLMHKDDDSTRRNTAQFRWFLMTPINIYVS